MPSPRDSIYKYELAGEWSVLAGKTDPRALDDGPGVSPQDPSRQRGGATALIARGRVACRLPERLHRAVARLSERRWRIRGRGSEQTEDAGRQDDPR